MHKQYLLCLLLLFGSLIQIATADGVETNDFLFVPGERAGLITSKSGESDLIRMYGKQNVQSAEIHIGEGQYEQGTVLYPNEPTKKIEILWDDPSAKKKPRSLTVEGKKSVWKTQEGITLGTTLKELEQLNGRSFSLLGFAWDCGGSITSWNNGKLQRFETKLGIALSEGEGKVTKEELFSVMGDHRFDSKNAVMQKLNPVVSTMGMGF